MATSVRRKRISSRALGSFMLGLRRLEDAGRVPVMDLAVLEETLDYYSLWMELTTETSIKHVPVVDNGRCARVVMTDLRVLPAIVIGARRTAKYLLELTYLEDFVYLPGRIGAGLSILFAGFFYDGVASATVAIPMFYGVAADFWIVEVDVVSRAIAATRVDSRLSPVAAEPMVKGFGHFEMTHVQPYVGVSAWTGPLNISVRVAELT